MQASGHCSRRQAEGHQGAAKIQALAEAGSAVPPNGKPAKPIISGCHENWIWDMWSKSPEVRLGGGGENGGSKLVHFHPNWSNGTAAVRGNKPLNYGVHYWEINVSQRVFGTSMMFGVCTKNASLHADSFINLIGEDEFSWGLSHKGTLWHNGQSKQFMRPFRENEATTIGLLFDWYRGTLSYYKDGEYLGVAFNGLTTQEDIYPVLSSTAAKTEMTLGVCIRNFDSLQDRCRAVIAQYCHNNGIDELPLPGKIRDYIKEVLYGQ